MINIDKIHSAHSYRLVLSPNRSISWHELVLCYGLMSLLSLAIGLFFAMQGLWLVLPFSGLEMLALGLGLYLVSRDTNRREVITFDNAKVRIEKGRYHCDRVWEFNAVWVRLNDRFADQVETKRKLELGSHGNYVEVGDFLSDIEKDELAFQLKGCIILA